MGMLRAAGPRRGRPDATARRPGRWCFFCKIVYKFFFVFFLFWMKKQCTRAFLFVSDAKKIYLSFFIFNVKVFSSIFLKFVSSNFFFQKLFWSIFFTSRYFSLKHFLEKILSDKKILKIGKKCQKINSMNLILRSPVN